MIEVTGTSSISIVPDLITVTIGMEEYYRRKGDGDSVVVKLSEIEKQVRKVLASAKVPDSLTRVSDIGNRSYRTLSRNFLMAKKIDVVLTGFRQLEILSEKMGLEGINSFQISSLNNSDMARYNRQGLKEALDAARSKAEFIAGNENLKIVMPYEIVENGMDYYDPPRLMMKSAAFDAANGGGMESMRRIVRRYSVRVRYMAEKGE